MQTIQLTEQEAKLLKELLALDLENIGFDTQDSEVLIGIGKRISE